MKLRLEFTHPHSGEQVVAPFLARRRRPRHAELRWPAVFATVVLVSAGCGSGAPPAVRDEGRGGDSIAAAGNGLTEHGLIPETATLERHLELPRDPREGEIHPDPRMAERIRLGWEIFRNTSTLAPRYAGNDLDCASCHLNGGQREGALPLVGVAGTFPQYRVRDDRLVTLEDRIAGCFKRSMNGTAPPRNAPESLALAAYIHWLSMGQPTGVKPEFTGRNEIPRSARIPIDELDPEAGRELYEAQCAACHGLDGQGVELGGMLAGVRPGPLWGDRSWNDGAGLARVWKFAGFIRWAMPLTAPGSLTDEESQLIAAWINAQDRAEYPDKANDFPAGGRPPDAVYDTLVFQTHPLRGRGVTRD